MPSFKNRIIEGNEIIEVVNKFAAGVQQIVLCSPYLTMAGLMPLLKRFKLKESVALDVISKFDEVEWLTGVTEPAAFQKLFELAGRKSNKWKIKIHLVDSLHTKAIVLGKKAAIIGSANITGGGFDRNFELGLFTTELRLIENILNTIDGYRMAGIPLTKESLAARIARIEGEEGLRIMGMLKALSGGFKDRRSPGLMEFTRERNLPLNYSTHVIQLLNFIHAHKEPNGGNYMPVSMLISWLNDKALNSSEPKASLKRIYFLESLGLIEEAPLEYWRITERGTKVQSNGEFELYCRLKNRWSLFDVLETLLNNKYKKKQFTVSQLVTDSALKRGNGSTLTVQALECYLRWLRSFGMIDRVKGTKGNLYFSKHGKI